MVMNVVAKLRTFRGLESVSALMWVVEPWHQPCVHINPDYIRDTDAILNKQ